MYMIVIWEIGETRMVGPFDTVEAAVESPEIEDTDANWVVLGPIPVAASK